MADWQHTITLETAPSHPNWDPLREKIARQLGISRSKVACGYRDERRFKVWIDCPASADKVKAIVQDAVRTLAA